MYTHSRFLRGASAGSVCDRSRRGSGRCTQSVTAATAGVAGGFIGAPQRSILAVTPPFSGRMVSDRSSSRRRQVHVHRTPVRSGNAAPSNSWLINAIVLYQRSVEGRPSPCRFTPGCSSYALEAIQVHGRRAGLWLSVRRMLRCRPFGPSGFDPVPQISRAQFARPHIRPQTEGYSS